MKLKLTLLASASLLALAAAAPAAAQEFSVFINRSLAPDAYCSPRRQQPQEPLVAQRPIPNPVVATDGTATRADRVSTIRSRSMNASLGGMP
jgi:hypothetical protein